MLDVRPFKGLRFDHRKVGSLSDVITPPYDVISATAQEQYYQKTPYNIIRIEYGTEQSGDSATDNKYSRAASFLQEWTAKGILVSEPDPAIYVYVQEFSFKGERYKRTGLVAAIRLEEWEKGAVLPHEETLAKPKADRLNLMSACEANISPIFGLYEDNGSIVQSIKDIISTKPDVDFVDEFGERHQLWVVTSENLLNTIHEEFLAKTIFIADGHHRYETALNYRDAVRELCSNCDDDEAFNFVMMVLVEANDPGLVVLPTHRLVRDLPGIDIERLEQEARKTFDVEIISCIQGQEDSTVSKLIGQMEEKSSKAHTFGMFSPQRKEFWLLTLRSEIESDAGETSGHTKAWRSLDVSILHERILDSLLGIDSASLKNESYLRYVRDEKEAVQEALQGECQLVFFLNPTKVHEVLAVALDNERMPQKSTYFYPKLPTGLIINKLEGKVPVPVKSQH